MTATNTVEAAAEAAIAAYRKLCPWLPAEFGAMFELALDNYRTCRFGSMQWQDLGPLRLEDAVIAVTKDFEKWLGDEYLTPRDVELHNLPRLVAGYAATGIPHLWANLLQRSRLTAMDAQDVKSAAAPDTPAGTPLAMQAGMLYLIATIGERDSQLDAVTTSEPYEVVNAICELAGSSLQTCQHVLLSASAYTEHRTDERFRHQDLPDFICACAWSYQHVNKRLDRQEAEGSPGRPPSPQIPTRALQLISNALWSTGKEGHAAVIGVIAARMQVTPNT